ncbi:zinc-binding dehydrogenase [Shouchella clausii]|uniref:zinc-dependent alcohol dehydrogenase n=1 Tax=Shouchella clausii TaxID=79880 RepID=UPI00289D9035|nr:zinc-binding dehydrogenase [Shouchella clausii]
MRAIQKLGTGKAQLTDKVPIPSYGPNDLLLKPLYSGICTTDLHVLYHGMGREEFPLTMGHEVSAIVVGIGNNVDTYVGSDRKIKVGDRVTVEPLFPCEKCDPCLQGKMNLCSNMSHLGIFDEGAYADYVRVPSHRTHRLPDGVSDLAGTFIEPLSCAINFIDKSQMKPGNFVVILGGGSIGQLALQVALASGGKVILSEPVAKKRELALKLGAHAVIDPINDNLIERVKDLTDNKGADIIIECVGVPATVSQMLKIVKRGGRCVLAGAPVKPVEMDFLPLWYGEVELVAAHATAWQFPRAMTLIELGLVDVEAALEQIVPFTEAVRALEEAYKSNEIGKMVIKHN